MVSLVLTLTKIELQDGGDNGGDGEQAARLAAGPFFIGDRRAASVAGD